jgi:hypothetical protein
LLPHLGDVSAAVSSYTRGADGWYVLSLPSYAARTAIAIVLLTPITLLMGATLTALIRHAGRVERVALLYGANTLGAALGCFLTDYALVPSFGLRSTQMIAVALNLVTAAGALWSKFQIPKSKFQIPRQKNVRIPDPASRIPVMSAATALVLTGAAGMGMEILWFPRLLHSARRVPRRLCAAARGDPSRHGRRVARGRIRAEADSAAGVDLRRRAGCLRRRHSAWLVVRQRARDQ